MSPDWLDKLAETGMLEPPNEDGPWPAFAAVEHLAADHRDAVAAWLTRMYETYGRDPVRAWFIARAAVGVGDAALPLVVRAVGDHPTSPAIAGLGVWAVDKLEPSGKLVESLADLLLNEVSWRGVRASSIRSWSGSSTACRLATLNVGFAFSASSCGPSMT